MKGLSAMPLVRLQEDRRSLVGERGCGDAERRCHPERAQRDLSPRARAVNCHPERAQRVEGSARAERRAASSERLSRLAASGQLSSPQPSATSEPSVALLERSGLSVTSPFRIRVPSSKRQTAPEHRSVPRPFSFPHPPSPHSLILSFPHFR